MHRPASGRSVRRGVTAAVGGAAVVARAGTASAKDPMVGGGASG